VSAGTAPPVCERLLCETGPMAVVAIIVNGMPGSGKTTVGASLAEVLGCPFLSKDAVKEPLADIAFPMIPSRALGGIAMDTVWAMAGAVEAGVVVDSIWVSDENLGYLEAGLERAGSPRVVELWCDIDRATAMERLRDRYEPDAPRRHDVHGDLADVTAFWDSVDAPGPIGPRAATPWPVVRLDTTKPFDVGSLVQEIAAHFG
jgi:predicted kinase